MSHDPNEYELDPVFVHAKREAKFILTSFSLFATYTVSVSYALGWHSAQQALAEPALILGMPHWVFWGIVVPWIAANVVTGWFCFGFIRDDPLLPDTSELDAPSSGTPANPPVAEADSQPTPGDPDE